MRRSRHFATSLTVLAAMLASRTTRAQPMGTDSAVTEEDAAAGERLLEEGLLRYDTAEYDQAIDLFRDAYKRTRASALLFNMAQAYRLKGDCRQAADLYRQFIRRDPGAADRKRAEGWLVTLGRCAAQTEAPSRQEAAPNSVHTREERSGDQRTVSLLSVDAPLPSATAYRHHSARISGLVLLGVGVCLVATAGYYWGR